MALSAYVMIWCMVVATPRATCVAVDMPSQEVCEQEGNRLSSRKYGVWRTFYVCVDRTEKKP